MKDITLLLGVRGTGLGVEAVMIDEGSGIQQLAVKSPPKVVDLNRLRRLGDFEHNYRGLVFPGQSIQKVIDDLEGRTPVSGYRRSPVTHLLYYGAESEQVQDSVGVTFSFAAFSESSN